MHTYLYHWDLEPREGLRVDVEVGAPAQRPVPLKRMLADLRPTVVMGVHPMALELPKERGQTAAPAGDDG